MDKVSFKLIMNIITADGNGVTLLRIQDLGVIRCIRDIVMYLLISYMLNNRFYYVFVNLIKISYLFRLVVCILFLFGRHTF